MKLDRLQNRIEKVLEGMFKSKLKSKEKAELYRIYHDFINDISDYFQRKHPYLKDEAP